MSTFQKMLMVAAVSLSLNAFAQTPPMGPAKPTSDDLQTTLTVLVQLRDAAPKGLEQVKLAQAADVVADKLRMAKIEEGTVVVDTTITGKEIIGVWTNNKKDVMTFTKSGEFKCPTAPAGNWKYIGKNQYLVTMSNGTSEVLTITNHAMTAASGWTANKK